MLLCCHFPHATLFVALFVTCTIPGHFGRPLHERYVNDWEIYDDFIFLSDDEHPDEVSSDAEFVSSGQNANAVEENLQGNSEISWYDDPDAKSSNLVDDDFHDRDSSLIGTGSNNMFALRELTSLRDIVERDQSLVASKDQLQPEISDNPMLCLPNECDRFNNEIEQALQYLPRLNPGPTFTNLLFSGCASSHKLLRCFQIDPQQKIEVCNNRTHAAMQRAIEIRHQHLCNVSILLGQCVAAIETSPAHRYCVVTAIANSANQQSLSGKSANSSQDILFNLCLALDNFLDCVFQGAAVCIAPGDNVKPQNSNNAKNNTEILSQAFFNLLQRFRQNKIYFAEFGRSLGMDANQLLVNYALLAADTSGSILKPDEMVRVCQLPHEQRIVALETSTTVVTSARTNIIIANNSNQKISSENQRSIQINLSEISIAVDTKISRIALFTALPLLFLVRLP